MSGPFEIKIRPSCPLFRGERRVKPKPDIRVSRRGHIWVENGWEMCRWQISEWEATRTGPFDPVFRKAAGFE